ncbi:MAG: NADPH-dependent FMN reductase [Flavobacteriales bacterium]
MITIIKGTNRKESTTSRVAMLLKEMIEKRGANVCLLDLAELPLNFFQPSMYDVRTPEFQEFINGPIVQTQRFVFAIPEYNGSYPGALKLFIDALPVETLRGKHATLVGLSDGHAGNIRGQEHLTGVLHHLKMHVHYHKPKLSGITKAFDAEGKLIQEDYRKLLEEHAEIVANGE